MSMGNVCLGHQPEGTKSKLLSECEAMENINIYDIHLQRSPPVKVECQHRFVVMQKHHLVIGSTHPSSPVSSSVKTNCSTTTCLTPKSPTCQQQVDDNNEEIGDSASLACTTIKKSQHEQIEENQTSHRDLASGSTMDTGQTDSTDSKSFILRQERSHVAFANKASRIAFNFGDSIKQIFETLVSFQLWNDNAVYSNNKQKSVSNTPLKVWGGVLLYGCDTPEEHFAYIKKITIDMKNFHSAEGLKLMGFEYRLVLCDNHRPVLPEREFCSSMIENAQSTTRTYCLQHNNVDSIILDSKQESNFIETVRSLSNVDIDVHGISTIVEGGITQMTLSDVDDDNDENIDEASQTSNFDINDSLAYENYENINNNNDDNTDIREMPIAVSESTDPKYGLCRCHFCMRKLFHIETNTIIDQSNRIKFIADGDMYETVSRLIQENAFDVMIEEGTLTWITVDNNDNNLHDNNGDDRRIRFLINSDHPLLLPVEERDKSILKDKPTLIICTGRGKVRAGIFSRQHLMCSGKEMSTCIPYIREAQARNINVMIIDPNIHGEVNGYITFQKTIQYWCKLTTTASTITVTQEPNHSTDRLGRNDDDNCSTAAELYGCCNTILLSHSASGGHLVRLLLEDDPRKQFLPYIRAVAFTDSTHNIQWATKSSKHTKLLNFIQSSRCVYFRCGNMKRDTKLTNDWYLHPPGEEIVGTDTFWQHRFGTIKTMWAGTDEHCLANWFALAKIWEHFDQYVS